MYTAITLISNPNEWLQPKSIKQIRFLRLEDIDFPLAESSMIMKLCKQMSQLHEPVN